MISNQTEINSISLPINIMNQTDLETYGFPGNGSAENPYIIENFSIINSSIILININITNCYFIIRNNTLNGITGEFQGIYIANTKNSIIYNNTISKTRSGIYLDSSQNNTILNNNISNCTLNGIEIFRSQNNSLLSNNLNYSKRGIYLDSFSFENRIINNSVLNNKNTGIYIDGGSWQNKIIGNKVYNNTDRGISIQNGCYNSQIINNNISKSEYGITVSGVNNNNISNNIIFNNQIGIQIYPLSYNNIIYSNLLLENSYYGMFLGEEGIERTVDDTLIMWNSFIDNNLEGTSQAYDLSVQNDFESKNTFVYNYWNNWKSPDNDLDGIVDNPYHIDGSNTSDYYPLSSREGITDHILSKPRIILPDTSENAEEIIINWNPAIDSFSLSVKYSLFFSADLGNSWNNLIINTTENFFIWNILLLDAGCYQLKVIASSTGGLSTMDLSNIFPLKMEHILSSLEISSPISDNSLSNNVTIHWTPAIDNCYYSVMYNISYSSDGGESWILLASRINSTSYIWDTSSVANGANYTLKIVAISSGGLVTSTISNDTFTIYNKFSSSSSEYFPFLEITILLFIFSELSILLILLKFIKKKKILNED